MRWTRVSLLLIGGMVLKPGAAGAQELTLEQALRQAAGQGFASRAAAAEFRARSAEASQTLRGILPAVHLELNAMRTTDPLGAFGATLRQRSVTPAAFDPARLNFPEAIGQVSTSIVLEQPLINLDAWYARQAASLGAGSAGAMHRWIQIGSQVEVVRSYYGAVLAAEMVRTLEDAVASARAHERQAASLFRNGMVTQSDALLASVRAGEVQSDLIAARGAVPIAHLNLALVLGAPGDASLALPSQLPSLLRIEQLGRAPVSTGSGKRADMEAADLALSAAAADKRRASAQLLPRINSFGRLDWNSGDRPFGQKESWTVGVMLSWSWFTGGAELAQRSSAEARRLGAESQAEAVAAQVRLDLSRAVIALDVALMQMEIRDSAVQQSIEAHRIVARKYDGGLATVVELFDAAAQETSARLNASQARYNAITALAERYRASGADLAGLTALEEGD
jgi:outer membrane protein TolC